RFDPIAGDPWVVAEARGDVADEVLDELRIVVGALGHELFVGALQQSIELARCFRLGNPDQLGDADRACRPPAAHADRDVRALVVRAVLGDLLRARTQAGYRSGDAEDRPDRIVADAA